MPMFPLFLCLLDLMDLREVSKTHHGKYAYVYRCLPIHVLQTLINLYIRLVRHVLLDQTRRSPWVSRKQMARVQMPFVIWDVGV